jgi:hypothetical protein
MLEEILYFLPVQILINLCIFQSKQRSFVNNIIALPDSAFLKRAIRKLYNNFKNRTEAPIWRNCLQVIQNLILE